MFNFVSKRPTDVDFREAAVTYNSNSVGTAHVDLSGRIDKNGVVKYRFNGRVRRRATATSKAAIRSVSWAT